MAPVAKSTPKKSSKTKPAAKPVKPRASAAAKPAAKNATKPSSAARRSQKRAPAAKPVVQAKAKTEAVASQQAHIPTRPNLNGKPAKNLAGLKPKELQLYRELLLAKRRELIGDVDSMEQEALRSEGGGSNLSNLPIHMADMGTDNYEQEFTLGLVQKDRDLLREIHIALVKIADGRYGICEGTGKPISKARLEAKPWARYSIEYARQLEKGLVRG